MSLVVIAGPPAAGKGTQCDKIKEKFGYIHISTGDILRQNVRLATELGEKAKPFMDAGKLVPSDLLVDLVKDRLQQKDVVEKGCLLDGFPRAPDQAKAMVDAGLKVDKFILIKVPDDTLVERGVGRRLDPETGTIYHMTFKPPPEDIVERLVHRSDDHEEQIRTRLATYHEQVQGILPFFQDSLVEVDGTADPDAVFGTISAGLESSKPHARLVFSRHGESEWNLANKFTGWVDVDLSEKGRGEAQNAGKLVKEAGISFDVCYTSYLKRAIKTCNLALENSDQLHVPVVKSWRLNERMYGGLTGLDKKETVVKHGAEQVAIWRRSFDLPPPDIEEDSEYHPKLEAKYKDLSPEEIPKTESLKTVIERVMPFWESSIMADLQAGKTVFVAAHGNSIRAIVKYLENIPDDVIPGLEIPTGTPLVYELDKDLKPLPNADAVEPLTAGKYLGDLEAIKAAAEKVKNQTKV